MKLLAIDTSTSKASVALFENGRVRKEMHIQDGKTHSEKLVPMIRQILEEEGMQPSDMDYFAAAAGPGSFTGLRIGIVTIKAIAMAVNRCCVPVPTLDALACNCSAWKGLICPMIDARNDQVFTALYSGGEEPILPRKHSIDMAKPVGELISDLLRVSAETEEKQVILTGDAAKKHWELLQQQGAEYGLSVLCAPENQLLADAGSVGRVAEALILQGKAVESDLLVPDYLRKSSAEQAKEQRERCREEC